MTGCDFSPDGSVVVTGTSVKRGSGAKPTLAFFSTRTLSRIATLEVDGASVVPLLWHPRLNQIVIGNADGKAYTLYDPTVSEKGALFCSVKAALLLAPSPPLPLSSPRLLSPFLSSPLLSPLPS